MERLRPFFDDLWRWSVGAERRLNSRVWVDPDKQWSHAFEGAMRRRILVGAYRYGPLGATGKPRYDRMGSIISRAAEYQRTGNLELLVDIANLCLLEFVEGKHPKRHFHAQDDSKHVEVL